MSEQETIASVGAERAAVLLLSLGEDTTTQVFKHMGSKELHKIGLAMANLDDIKKEKLVQVLDEFLAEVDKKTGLAIGTEDYVKRTLKKALGSEKSKSIIDRIMMGANTKGLDSLRWIEAKSVADVIKHEHPQIQSIVLSYLDPEQAAQIIALLPEQLRTDLMLRISALESIQPAALQELNTIMERQFSGTSTAQSASIGGINKAAEIMNYLDSGVENELMDNLNEIDENLAGKIKEMMFVFADLIDIDGRDIQKILKEIQSDRLMIALKGADETLKEKFLGNMSKRAGDLLRDDMEAMGPVKLSEVELAQREIVTTAQRLAEEGEIILGNMGEEMV